MLALISAAQSCIFQLSLVMVELDEMLILKVSRITLGGKLIGC